jgi:lipoprotein NlpD
VSGQSRLGLRAGLLAGLLGIALAGCSSRPAAPPARTAQAAGDVPSGKSSRGARPPAEAVAKADRTFLRPARGAIIQGYDGRNNKGIDFAGARGDPVYAARDGKVVYASDGLRGYGQMVMIRHDATYLTAYAHNSELLVKEGAAVKRGQVIALMGNTETDRVKLHFELRRNGNAVDPAGYFMAAAGDPG